MMSCLAPCGSLVLSGGLVPLITPPIRSPTVVSSPPAGPIVIGVLAAFVTSLTMDDPPDDAAPGLRPEKSNAELVGSRVGGISEPPCTGPSAAAYCDMPRPKPPVPESVGGCQRPPRPSIASMPLSWSASVSRTPAWDFPVSRETPLRTPVIRGSRWRPPSPASRRVCQSWSTPEWPDRTALSRAEGVVPRFGSATGTPAISVMKDAPVIS